MSFFEILAECAVAFAGFGAIHAVLEGATSGRGYLRSFTIVMLGTLAFLLCVLPLVLDLSSLSSVLLWRVASAVGLIGSGGALYALFTLSARLTAMGHPPPAPWTIQTALILGLLATCSMLSNLVGWPGAPGPLLYGAAVSLILGQGIMALLHSFWVPLEAALASIRDSWQERTNHPEEH
jgi:hypothetical protein